MLHSFLHRFGIEAAFFQTIYYYLEGERPIYEVSTDAELVMRPCIGLAPKKIMIVEIDKWQTYGELHFLGKKVSKRLCDLFNARSGQIADVNAALRFLEGIDILVPAGHGAFDQRLLSECLYPVSRGQIREQKIRLCPDLDPRCFKKLCMVAHDRVREVFQIALPT